MARPIRHMESPFTLFAVSIRCMQERFLLRPSPQLDLLIRGVLGRALALYPDVQLFAFKFASNHFHLILAAPDNKTLALFMNHINSCIAREAGRLHHWRDKFWSRRYRPLSIQDDASVRTQLKYVLAHGCKEGLVPHPLDWPGVSSDRALLFGEKIEGVWYDRAAFYEAERRGKPLRLKDFAIRYEVPLSTLPLLEGKSEEEKRAYVQAIVDEIAQEAHQTCVKEKKRFLGVEAILAQDPYGQPRKSKKSPAPLCHASTKRGRQRYRRIYREFVSLYRQAVDKLRQGEKDVQFPPDCFLPPLLCPPLLSAAAAPG